MINYKFFYVFHSLSKTIQKLVQFSEIQLAKVEQSMTCVSVISLTGWLMLRTVSLTMLYYLKLLSLLSHNLINFGNIKILLDAGIEASACARNSTTVCQFACARGERRRPATTLARLA